MNDEEWRQHSVARNIECKCGGEVRFLEYTGSNTTRLKCRDCEEIGTATADGDLDGLRWKSTVRSALNKLGL